MSMPPPRPRNIKYYLLLNQQDKYPNDPFTSLIDVNISGANNTTCTVFPFKSNSGPQLGTDRSDAAINPEKRDDDRTTQFLSISSPNQPQSLLYQFKPQCPPFPKWDGTLPTITMLIEQIETYKAEAFYAGVHDWTQTTPTNRQLSVTISSDMMYSLPSSISSMFLNDARFASDRIAMLSSLLTHLKPSSNENLLISI